MERSDTRPEEVIAGVPEHQRDDMAALHAALAERLAGLPITVWEGNFWGGTRQRIIGYGDHTYTNASGKPVEWYVVGLAAQKQHLSVYVSAAEDGEYLARRHADRLGKVKVGSANITFRRLEDVDLPALLDLVERARDLMARG